MHRRHWLVAISTLAVPTFLVRPARADVAYGPRPDLNIQVRFDNLQEYPGFDFYLKYGLGPGNPYASLHLTPVVPGTTTLLGGKGGRLTEVYLVAVPRGRSVLPPPRGYIGGEWLTDTSGGLRSAPLPTNHSGTRLSEGFTGYSLRYRVRIEGDRLEVTCVEQTQSRQTPLLGGSAATWLGGLGLAMATATAAVLWLRRSGRSAGRLS